MIERDDLSLPENAGLIAEREKWTSEERAGEPLFFASYQDFVTFPPEGPLRQIPSSRCACSASERSISRSAAPSASF